MVRQWEVETYPAIRAQARAEGAMIYFAGESGLRSDYHTGTTWAPKGQTPVVGVTGARFAVAIFRGCTADYRRLPETQRRFSLKLHHAPRLRLAAFQDRPHHEGREQDGEITHDA